MYKLNKMYFVILKRYSSSYKSMILKLKLVVFFLFDRKYFRIKIYIPNDNENNFHLISIKLILDVQTNYSY